MTEIIIHAPEPNAVPAEWKMVPIKPTMFMVASALAVDWRRGEEIIRAIWSAMLRDTPTPSFADTDCPTCDGTGNEGRHSICRDCDETPSPASNSRGIVEAARDVIASASDSYKKRNGHLASFEDDSGEKCWIVPFDAFESLRAALKPQDSADV